MIVFKQLNCGKRKNCWDNLNYEMSHDKYKFKTIYLLSEPYLLRDGRCPKLPLGFQCYGERFSRTKIIAHSSLNLWYSPEFSEKDITTCILKIDKKCWFLASLYLDILLDPVHPIFDNLVNTITISGDQLIVGADTNSHSPMWFSKDCNQRGMVLEEYLMNMQINIENVGNKNTFIRKDCESLIDVTFSKNLTYDIMDWHVVSEFKFSDHLMIEFYLPVQERKEEKVLDLNKCNFDRFRKNLPQNRSFVKKWDIYSIERETSQIESSITAAIKMSCPVKKPTKHKIKWWDNSLHKVKVEVKNLGIKAWNSKTAEDWEKFSAANKAYTKLVRKAKRQTWQKWCSEIDTPQNMAWLNKAISRKENKTLSLLKYPDGRYTRSARQVANILLDSHFPGSLGIDPQIVDGEPNDGKTCCAWELESSFITKQKVIEAFKSFGPGKASGPDNIKPRFLHNLDDNMLNRITWLFRACLKLNYTPKSWRNSKCIFIPKMGKDDYTSVRSFRPISLVSFLFKALERIVLWYLEENVLSINKLSPDQHAFRRNFSTDTALSDFTDDAESAIMRGQYAIGAFIDVQGAFDMVNHEAAIKGMAAKNFPIDIQEWYAQFLKNRTVFTDVLGAQAHRKITKGVGQGLVLSPVIWCLIFDSFLDLFKTGPIRARGFADDGCLLIKGPDPSSMVSIMQQGLNKVQKWAEQQELLLSPSKTVTMIFHRKNKKTFIQPKKLKLNGVEIEYSKTTKYLGCVLDTKLCWKNHIELKIQKAKRHLMMIKQSIGVRWGPQPKALKWAYQGIVLPSLTFGAIVWAKACETKGLRDKLSKLNRLISLLMCPMRKKTPTNGLQVILDLKPVDLVIREAALKSFLRVNAHHRTKWEGIGHNKSHGHLKWCSVKLNNHNIKPDGYDKTIFLNLDRKFKTDLESTASGLPTTTSSTQCYTDGSRLGNRSGYGLCITQDGSEVTKKNGYLGSNATVFQCEVYAIQKASEILRNMETNSVTIFTDSQAALKALAKVQINSSVVKNCILELNKLGANTSVEIKWVRAHCGHYYNECADQEAKSGTKKLVEEKIPPPFRMALSKIEEATRKLWDQRWAQGIDCRQTKQWFPVTNNSLSKNLMRTSRHQLGQIVQLVTGHNFLRYQQNVINSDINPLCRLCGEANEDAFHIVCICPAFWRLRAEVFKTYKTIDTLEWSVRQVLKLVSNPQLSSLLEGEGEEEPNIQ